MSIKVEYKEIRKGTLDKSPVNVIHFKKNGTIVAELRVESNTVRFYNTLSLTKIELGFILDQMED